jgi:Uma2 family endonuclease
METLATVSTAPARFQPLPDEEEIFYPSSDGKPMAENTKQWNLIVQIKCNLERYIRNDFVASDLLWYPVKGHPEISVAPDVLVAFGRPIGDRLSYKQWEENNQPPQVVFEIWSPSNLAFHKREKLAFYDQYGVLEYYAFDPDTGLLEGWINKGLGLEAIQSMQEWVSPLLHVRFVTEQDELVMFMPDGTRALPVVEMYDQLDAALQSATTAEAKIEIERIRAEAAEAKAKAAQKRARAAEVRAEEDRQMKERAFAKLRELGIDPNSL